MDKNERFALFVREMEEAAPAASFEEARLLLETVLNGVEDRHSGVPYNPENWQADGRLYPPHDDSERKSDTRGVRIFRTRGHRVSIAENGALRIVAADLPARIIFEKVGKDGRVCPD